MNEVGGKESGPWWARYTDWTRFLPETVKDQSRRIGKLLLLGFALRVVLLPIFGSTDATTTAWIGTVLMARGQLILSNDPPPIFYLHALIFEVFRPIYPAAIFNRFVSPVAFTPGVLFPRSILSEPGIGILLTLVKLPYLAFDLASAVLLLWLVREPKPAVRALKMWLFNPIVLYVTYFFGQFDIVAVFFVSWLLLGGFGGMSGTANATLPLLLQVAGIVLLAASGWLGGEMVYGKPEEKQEAQPAHGPLTIASVAATLFDPRSSSRSRSPPPYLLRPSSSLLCFKPPFTNPRITPSPEI